MKKLLPDQNVLFSLFTYLDGKLYWKVSIAQSIKIGDEAGCLHKSGYITVRIYKNQYQQHNIIWKMLTGNDPEFNIDHINHIKTDNRIENLRDINHKENQKNKSIMKNNSTGYNGINKLSENRWQVRIMFNGKRYCKSFSSLEKAILHRDEKHIEFGYHENHGSTFS